MCESEWDCLEDLRRGGGGGVGGGWGAGGDQKGKITQHVHSALPDIIAQGVYFLQARVRSQCRLPLKALQQGSVDSCLHHMQQNVSTLGV